MVTPIQNGFECDITKFGCDDIIRNWLRIAMKNKLLLPNLRFWFGYQKLLRSISASGAMMVQKYC
jgi:hypothetical protein